MKVTINSIIVIAIIVLLTTRQCDQWLPCGQDHNMPSSYKIEYSFGDKLVYQNSSLEKIEYSLSYFMSGDYLVSQTGESASGCYAYYEFEIIGICPIDVNSCTEYEIDTIYTTGNRPRQIDCPNCLSIYKIMDTRPINDANRRISDPIIQWKDSWECYLGNNSNTHAQIELNDIKYYDVYAFNTEFEDEGKIIVEIYFNYKKGFVGYKTEEGEVWNLLIDAE
jgi:hypothetical protein